MSVLICHDEAMKCKCGSVLEEVPIEGSARSRFSFPMTHKRDGTPIKDLGTKGPFLGVAELGWCATCEDYFLILDTEDDPEAWSKLPKLHKPQ